MSTNQIATELRSLKSELIGLIDAGATDDYTVSVRQGDILKWFDRLDDLELRVLALTPAESKSHG